MSDEKGQLQKPRGKPTKREGRRKEMLKSFYYNDSIAATRWLDTLEAITIGRMANGSLLRVTGTEHIKPLVSGGKPNREIPRIGCVQMSLYTSDIFSVKKTKNKKKTFWDLMMETCWLLKRFLPCLLGFASWFLDDTGDSSQKTKKKKGTNNLESFQSG